jgi:hypothetical protein
MQIGIYRALEVLKPVGIIMVQENLIKKYRNDANVLLI